MKLGLAFIQSPVVEEEPCRSQCITHLGHMFRLSTSDHATSSKARFWCLIASTTPYFFGAESPSALAFARFSLTPTRRASLLAFLSVAYASVVPSPMSLVLTSPIASSKLTFSIGRILPRFLMILPCSSSAALISSFEASNVLCWPDLRGKRIRRAW